MGICTLRILSRPLLLSKSRSSYWVTKGGGAHYGYSAFLRVFIQKGGWTLPVLYKLLNELRELAALVRSWFHVHADIHEAIFLRETSSWTAKERHLLVVKTLRGCAT